MKVDEFYELTPYELNVSIETFIKNKKDMFIENVVIAYYNAYFQRVSKMPNLKTFIDKLDKKEMSDDDIYKNILSLHKKFGGE